MSYVAPNSDIYLLKGVPLSKDYENTILFSTAAAQSAYFTAKCPGTTYSFADVSFVRSTPGEVKLEIAQETAMLCNYMMYRNTSYGNKWFYAFIDSVDYVNDKTSLIHFTMDKIQTWHFDYALTDVFLERNHTKTDAIGDSLTAEPVRFGDYVDNAKTSLLSETFYAIVATVDVDGTSTPLPGTQVMIPTIGAITVTTATCGALYQHIYSGATLTVFSMASTDDIDAFLSYYIQQAKADAIVGIYMVPAEVLGLSQGQIITPATGGEQLGSVVNYIDTDTYNALPGLTLTGTGQSTLDGYLPKNNKCYTYPYNKLTINNGSGNELNLRYELFNEPTTPTGHMTINVQMPVSVCFMPNNYAGIGPIATTPPANVANQDYQIMLANYPLCSWNVDTYAAWSAQNSINLGSSMLGMGYDAAKGYFGGTLTGQGAAGALGAGLGGISSLISMLMQGYHAYRAADTLHGSNSSGNGAIAQFRQNFFAKRMSVNAQDAKIIDNYFTMFGYTINAICHPGTNEDPRDHRPYYTFIKTIGCDIQGDIPADDAAEINRIYDKGIRWWKYQNGMKVGDYTQDNAPVVPTPSTPSTP